MTIALGVLAGTGLVIAADSEETIGLDKVSTLKTRIAFPPDGISAFAVSGAGNGWYVDTIAQDLEKIYNLHKGSSIDDLELALECELGKFYADHVIPFASDDLDFQLLIGFQRDHMNALWVTGKNAMRRVYGHEAVGVGDIQAKVILDGSLVDTIAQGVLVACCAVYQAKQNTVGCGKSTVITCLYKNRLHDVFPDIIHSIETWFQKYLNTVHSGFTYCIGSSVFSDGDVSKIEYWYRDLRREALALTDKIQKDIESR